MSFYVNTGHLYLQYLNITTIELRNNHKQKGRGCDVHEKGHEENTYLDEKVEHIARMRYKRNIHKVLVRNWKGKDHLQDVDEDGRTVLNLKNKVRGKRLN